MDCEYWMQELTCKGRFDSIDEGWKEDTISYISKVKEKASPDSKEFLDGLIKHLKEKGFLSDEQKKMLANIKKFVKIDTKKTTEEPKKEVKDTSKDTSKDKEPDKKTTKDKPKNDIKDAPKDKPKKEKKSSVLSPDTKKEIKDGAIKALGKLGDLAKWGGSKLDKQAVDAIETGVQQGQEVGEVTKNVLSKIKNDLLAKQKEAKEKQEKAKKETEKKLKQKQESFSYRFKSFINN